MSPFLQGTFDSSISFSIQPSLISGAIIGYPLAVLLNNLYIYFFCEAPSTWFFFLCGLGIMILIFRLNDAGERKCIGPSSFQELWDGAKKLFQQ